MVARSTPASRISNQSPNAVFIAFHQQQYVLRDVDEVTGAVYHLFDQLTGDGGWELHESHNDRKK